MNIGILTGNMNAIGIILSGQYIKRIARYTGIVIMMAIDLIRVGNNL
jgi:hypothetical protein